MKVQELKEKEKKKQEEARLRLEWEEREKRRRETEIKDIQVRFSSHLSSLVCSITLYRLSREMDRAFIVLVFKSPKSHNESHGRLFNFSWTSLILSTLFVFL
jgi:hypothetical protein